MVKRIITAALLAALAIPCMIMQGIPFLCLVLFFTILAVSETLGLFKGTWKKSSLLLLGIVMIVSVLALPSYLGVPLILISSAIVLVNDENARIDQVAIVFMNALIFILSVENVRTVGNSLYGAIYFIIFGCSLMCDTGAYFVGRKFGKRKLCPRLSPKKSVEGAIGGWMFGALTGLLFGVLFINVIPTELSWPFVIVAALVVPLLSEIGDLYFSSIKRYVGIKDFGNIFPGHGGGLDRIDGLLFGLMSMRTLLTIASVIGSLL